MSKFQQELEKYANRIAEEKRKNEEKTDKAHLIAEREKKSVLNKNDRRSK